jgi:hypothetical protein
LAAGSTIGGIDTEISLGPFILRGKASFVGKIAIVRHALLIAVALEFGIRTEGIIAGYFAFSLAIPAGSSGAVCTGGALVCIGAILAFGSPVRSRGAPVVRIAR